MFILIVTWLIAGQPATNYQVVFDSQAACMKARAAIYADAARLAKAEADREAANDAEMARKGVGFVASSRAAGPQVSALCVPK